MCVEVPSRQEMDIELCNETEEKVQTDWFPSLEQCEFVWIVENVSFCPRRGKNNILRSPIFAAGVKSPVRWYLKLCPNAPDELEKAVDLHLYRSRDDKGPKKVNVACKFSFRNGERYILDKEVFDYAFKRGSNFKISLKPFDIILQAIVACGASPDALSIVCDMFLYGAKMEAFQMEESILPPMNPDLQQLSKDLVTLFFSGNFSDASVKTADGEIKVHSAVLAARSSVFKEQLFRDSSEFPCITIENQSKAVCEKVLLYVYSGKLEISAQDVHLMFGIRECAQQYKLHLQEALIPNKLVARTFIEVERCEMHWKLEDFTVPDDGYIQSPFFGVCFRRVESWFLRLRIKLFEDLRSRIDVEAGVHDLSRSVHLKLDVSISNQVGTFSQIVGTTSMLDSDSVLPLSSLCPKEKEEIPNYLVKDDIILVHCIMKLCDMNPITGDIEKFQTSGETSNALRTSLMELSKNLLHLQEQCYFSDKMLRVGSRVMRVHKAVLCARSPVFAAMFQELEDSGGPSGELTIPDLTPDQLKRLIKYIYSGKITVSSFSEADTLYLAADRYCVPIVKFMPSE